MKYFVLGEHEDGRKHFEDKFKFNVKGRGKSDKVKIELASCVSFQDEDVIIVDPESDYNLK